MATVISGLVNFKKGVVTLITQESRPELAYEAAITESGEVIKKYGTNPVGLKWNHTTNEIITRVSNGDTFDMYTGLAICYATFHLGSKTKLRKMAEESGVDLEAAAKLVMANKCGTFKSFKEHIDNMVEQGIIRIIKIEKENE